MYKQAAYNKNNTREEEKKKLRDEIDQHATTQKQKRWNTNFKCEKIGIHACISISTHKQYIDLTFHLSFKE